MTGFVSLVGAGPGCPELLTLGAVRRLEAADLVLYDALVSPEVLAYARDAKRFFVGKRAGRHAVDQRTIERIMIRAARRGARVVRLKAGDPFVFGRGGEEALALRAAGVPFEVLPGVSAAVAAPALAGIPVTHRGVAASFFVASGHDPELLAPTLARLQPGATTVVILMGLRHRQTLAKMLTASGWPSRLPVAIVWAASTPGERRWYGTLAELGEVALEQVDEAAGTIVLGDVVNVAVELGARACVPCAPGNMLNQA